LLRRLQSQAAAAAESARLAEGLAAPAPPPEYAPERAAILRAEAALARARLRGAREARGLEERRHAAEVARQTVAARSQLEQLEAARAGLAAQLAAIETQVGQLAAVRAPFAGRVERLTWEEQHDQKITVVLYLAVTGE